MKKIKFLLRNHFGFSQRETNGFILLVGLMFGTLFLPAIFRVLYQPPFQSSTEDQRLLDSLLAAMTVPSEKVVTIGKDSSPSTLFHFDPNTASEKELEKVLGKRTAKTILKFRSKGGKFRVKQDLKRIYGMNGDLYDQLQSWILLPDTLSVKKKDSLVKNPRVALHPVAYLPVDINLADSVSLERLPGIGKVLANRIIKYRNKLGGFIALEQLKEVYGLTPEVIESLKERIYIREGYIPDQINLSAASFNSLQAHPYIGKRIAMLIVKYREQHGKFSSHEGLQAMKGVSEEEILKFIPYVTY